MSKNLSKKKLSKYSQKLLDHAWKSVIDAFKTSSKKSNSRTAEATGDFIDIKTANKIKKFSRTLPQNTSKKNEI